MKNLQKRNFTDSGKIFLCLVVFLSLSCQTPIDKNFEADEHDAYQGVEQWQNVLPDIVSGKSIIVEKTNSIQKAIDASSPGTSIYIEPGTYNEALTIDKSDIKLIGIAGVNEHEVILENPGDAKKGISVNGSAVGIEIQKIRLQKFPDNSIEVPSRASTSSGRKSHYFSMSRSQVTNGIAHYEFEIRMGEGEFDVIRIHRVVKEKRAYRPGRTKGEIFMIHGASQDFDDIFFTAGAFNNINAQTSSPVYLASKDIDVWGIDLGWTRVPVGTTDFDFMKEWGIEKDTDHTLAALSLARLIRGLTGQGFGKLNLLGFSYGGFVTYAGAGRETQKHPFLRNIKGIISADGGMKLEPTTENQPYITNACNNAANAWSNISSGVYHADNTSFAAIGNLATSAPGDPSPIIPGLTNYQVPMFFGSSIYLIAPPQVPFWHFTAGNPNDLYYTDEGRWIALLSTGAPYQPRLTNYNAAACICNQEDVSIDDHLSEISVPILFLGAGGGLGTYGLYTTTLTSSSDITSHIVSLVDGEDQRANDFGHADLFMADNAPELAWSFLRQWLVQHH